MPTTTTTRRPDLGDYPENFAGYVARIGDENVMDVLAVQHAELPERLKDLPEPRGDYRYASGKWSVKEVIGHLSDTERVFAYRALRIGRGDSTPLTSFADQAYVGEMHMDARSLASTAAEWSDVRQASLSLLRNLPAVAWERRGAVIGHPISVSALAYIIAGHTRHHLEVLESRYGV